MLKWFVAVACLVAASLAHADESTIRHVIEAKLGVRVAGIQPAPMPGLFEVRFRSSEGYRVVYTDADATHIIVGEIYDTRSDRNLTEERVRKLSAIDFSKLPLDLAVKITRGNGRRTLALFSDPHCPYCRRLEKTLLGIDDITVYVFLYPIIHPELTDHSRAVWCSRDRAKAWLALAASDPAKVPSASPSCPNPIAKTLALGHSLGITSTPTLYFANGERVNGVMPADQLVKMLDTAGRARTRATK